MRKTPVTILASLFCTFLLAVTTIATAQSDCSALNAAKGEGKFTGQISIPPDGSSITVTYGGQSVLVHYSNAVTVCQGGQPASVDALRQGASVSVFGPLRRSGGSMEMDAARIFVAGRPQAPRPNLGSAPLNSQIPRPNPASQPPNSQLARSNPEQTLPGSQEINPRPLVQRPVPNSVILSGGTYADTMQRLRVSRKYALSDLRASPQMTLGEAKLDFRPMLNNPKALFNIAQQLRAMPQHVQVQEDSSEISEAEQGLVIHHVLTYRILPGKCSDSDARTQLSRAGVECFTRASVNDRVAEFSRPGTRHYVADAAKRQTAVASFQRNSALADADASKGIANLRKALADPSQRTAITARVGEAETARMASFTDDQLKEELINSSVQRFEETMFVPKLQSSNYAHPPHTLTITPSAGEMAAAQQLLRDGVPARGAGPSNYPKLLKVVPSAALNHFAGSTAPGGDKVADLNMGPYIFLTGFTVGHDYEWSWGAQITINWCVVGCSSTYGLGLHAGFNYGFGLRFPIQTQFKYHTLVHPNNSAEANLSASLKPIEGTVDDFFSAGLSGDQMYDAKELVAQVGGDAGFSLNLPGLNVNPDIQVGVDFTDFLPAPYTHGSFQPPAPGNPGINSPFVLTGIDLLGGLLNYGVAGGQVFPAVNINLHSDKLQMTLNDEIQRRQTLLNSTSSQSFPLGVNREQNENSSHFSVGNPVYNLGFTVTPGLSPSVFVDIAVWSGQWSWPIWFPQLAVDLPPNGIDFGCHAGTTCVMDFEPVYNATTGQVQDLSKERDVADRTLTGGGCQRANGREGDYLCPVNGMLGLCKTMLSNGAVSSCGALVPTVVDQILKRGHCTGGGSDGAYSCPHDMMGLCQLYIKNQEILSCTQTK